MRYETPIETRIRGLQRPSIIMALDECCTRGSAWLGTVVLFVQMGRGPRYVRCPSAEDVMLLYMSDHWKKPEFETGHAFVGPGLDYKEKPLDIVHDAVVEHALWLMHVVHAVHMHICFVVVVIAFECFVIVRIVRRQS